MEVEAACVSHEGILKAYKLQALPCANCKHAKNRKKTQDRHANTHANTHTTHITGYVVLQKLSMQQVTLKHYEYGKHH